MFRNWRMKPKIESKTGFVAEEVSDGKKDPFEVTMAKLTRRETG